MRKAIQYQKTLRANPVSVPDKWTLLRKLGQDKLSNRAQLKLEWIIFYHTVGKTSVVSIYSPTFLHIQGGRKPNDQIRIISDGKNTLVQNINYNPDEDDPIISIIDDRDNAT